MFEGTRGSPRAPKQDGIKVASQHGEAIGGNGNAVGEVASGAPVELGGFDGGTRGLDNLYGLADDFGADAVSGNDGDAFFLGHELEDYQLGWGLSFFVAGSRKFEQQALSRKRR